MVECRNLDARLDALELALAEVPTDREDLARALGVSDGPIGVLSSDVHVLNELDVGVARQEGLIGVVGARGIVAGDERVGRSVHERCARNPFSDSIDEAAHPTLRPGGGRISARDGEDLEVVAGLGHPVDDDLGGLLPLFVGDLGEVGELVRVGRDAHREHRDTLCHRLVGDVGHADVI